jgi:colicin import membrane protein
MNMAEQKESSVLFSLKELMNLEEDRIKDEETAQERSRAAEQAARDDAQRRMVDAQNAAVREAQEQQRREAERQQEAAARAEGLRQAQIETARIQAEAEARTMAQRAQQEHDQRMAAVSGDKKKKQLTIMLGVGGVVMVLGLIGGGLALKSQLDAREASERTHRAENEAAQAELNKLKNDLKAKEDAVSALEGDVKNAKTEVERTAKLQALADAQAKLKAANAAVGGATGPRPAANPGGARPTGKACNCPPGDPLCSCL